MKDTVNGFYEISNATATIGEEINIATQQEIAVGKLAEEIIKQINPKAQIICEEERLRTENSEVNRLLGSNEKIQRLTDWKVQYSLEEGIKETIEWIRDILNSYKTEIYNI